MVAAPWMFVVMFENGKTAPEFDTEQPMRHCQEVRLSLAALLVFLPIGFNGSPLPLFCLLPEVLLTALAD